MAENRYELNINIGNGKSGNTAESIGSTGSSERGGVLSSIRGYVDSTKKTHNTKGVALVAGSVINYVTSRVAVTTGNYQRQQDIKAVNTVLSQVGLIAGGFLSGGPIGGALAIGGVGLSYLLAYDSYNFNRRAEATQLSIRREREGLISVTRSRGTVQ